MKIPKQKKIRDMIQDRKKIRTKRSYQNNNNEDKPEKSVYKSKIKYSVFLTMLKATLDNINKKGESELCRIVQDWWITAFGLRPFPVKGGSLNDLQVAIRYELMYQGMKENDIEISKTFLQNHSAAVNFEFDNFTENVQMLRRCDRLNEMRDYVIYPKLDNNDQMEIIKESRSEQKTFYLNTEEDDMSTKKSKKVAKKETKKTVQKTEKKERKLGGTGLACVLLMEKKYTDDEIYEKIIKECPDFKKDYISRQRNDINKGRKSSYKVTSPMPRYVRDRSGKLVIAGSIKKEKKEKASKKASKKTSKKK